MLKEDICGFHDQVGFLQSIKSFSSSWISAYSHLSHKLVLVPSISFPDCFRTQVLACTSFVCYLKWCNKNVGILNSQTRFRRISATGKNSRHTPRKRTPLKGGCFYTLIAPYGLPTKSVHRWYSQPFKTSEVLECFFSYTDVLCQTWQHSFLWRHILLHNVRSAIPANSIQQSKIIEKAWFLLSAMRAEFFQALNGSASTRICGKDLNSIMLSQCSLDHVWQGDAQHCLLPSTTAWWALSTLISSSIGSQKSGKQLK